MTLREYLKDHHYVTILGVIASIMTIWSFIDFWKIKIIDEMIKRQILQIANYQKHRASNNYKDQKSNYRKFTYL
jgi:hypothetical protein